MTVTMDVRNERRVRLNDNTRAYHQYYTLSVYKVLRQTVYMYKYASLGRISIEHLGTLKPDPQNKSNRIQQPKPFYYRFRQFDDITFGKGIRR